MEIDYKGTRWFKCDFHLHTPASKCFQDQNITPKQWVEKAIEKGLNCVAITDHNSGEWIGKIKDAAVGTALTVFPGVELTCDTSKVHLLIIFDTNSTSDDVNDFIIRCGIDRNMFAEDNAGSMKTIFEIAEIAEQHGTILIPAHVDEFNGLGGISNNNLETFYNLPYINAIQVVHNKFTVESLQINNNEALKSYINELYNNPTPEIDFAKIKSWYRPVKKAVEKKL